MLYETKRFRCIPRCWAVVRISDGVIVGYYCKDYAKQVAKERSERESKAVPSGSIQG